MNTKKVTTILITLIVIEFSIIGIFIKDYKNSLVTVSIVNDNNIKLSNAFTKVKKEKTITIEDRSNGECAMALEFYYQDYYFTCIKSHNVIVTVNGKSYTIKEALNSKIVTMDELINVGFKPLKKNTYAIK
mgnify:CR=1 FL=1